MKATRFMVLVASAAVAMLGFNAYAFHSGGVAECEGCHSMHSPASTSHLLVGTTPSQTCFSCHEQPDTAPNGYHIATKGDFLAGELPVERTPGGDFAWLKKTYTWQGETGVDEETGASHGHNIIATDSGYDMDNDSTSAYGPGGTFPKSALGCASCHDPHGKARRDSAGNYGATGTGVIIGSGSYTTSLTPAAGQAVGVYRLLWGAASPNKPTGANYTSYPVAVAPSTYNQTEATNQVRVAYGAGTSANSWGKWCGACHGDFTANDGKHHPVDQALGSTISTNYVSYVKSGDMSGTFATSYTSLVPFAESTEDFTVLKSHASNKDAYLGGPSSSDAVTCLSCHRAHASGFGDDLRFYYSWEFTTYNGMYPGLDNPSMTSSRKPIQASGRNMADFKAAYYDRDPSKFATYQRALCNKCHAQD